MAKEKKDSKKVKISSLIRNAVNSVNEDKFSEASDTLKTVIKGKIKNQVTKAKAKFLSK